jgi:hypothetical protein
MHVSAHFTSSLKQSGASTNGATMQDLVLKDDRPLENDHIVCYPNKRKHLLNRAVTVQDIHDQGDANVWPFRSKHELLDCTPQTLKTIT